MSAEGVATVPQCKECGAVWLPGDPERWHCFVVDDGSQDRLVFYCCPECAEREFGDLGEE